MVVTLRVRARVRRDAPIEARLTNDRQTYRLPVWKTVPTPIAKVSLVVENPEGWEIVPEGQWEVIEVIDVIEPQG